MEGQRCQNRPFFFLGGKKTQRKIGAKIDRFSGGRGGSNSLIPFVQPTDPQQAKNTCDAQLNLGIPSKKPRDPQQAPSTLWCKLRPRDPE